MDYFLMFSVMKKTQISSHLKILSKFSIYKWRNPCIANRLWLIFCSNYVMMYILRVNWMFHVDLFWPQLCENIKSYFAAGCGWIHQEEGRHWVVNDPKGVIWYLSSESSHFKIPSYLCNMACWHSISHYTTAASMYVFAYNSA